jgi:transposase
MQKRRYSKEFKDSAIQMALNSNEEIKTLAQDLDMNEKTLYNWIYIYKRDNDLLTRTNQTNKPQTKESLNEELYRLRKENRLLKQERDILKKATAYFAKGTL